MSSKTSHELIEVFEQAWNTLPPPDLAQFALNVATDVQREILLVDLERRYRSKRGMLQDELGHQPRLEDYSKHFEPLGTRLEITMEMVAEEYRVRSIWGDTPSAAHYAQRFPQFATQLDAVFQAVDADLRRERTVPLQLEFEFDPRAPLRHQDFELLQMIGAGAVGKVYRGRQKSLDRLVALKALHKRWLREDWAVDAFLREGQILGQLNHHGVASVFGMGKFPAGGFFQVMELVEGSDLRTWFQISNASSSDDRIRVFREVVDAISHAHQFGVIHCDLKPENILISNEERVVVVDFGMACLRNPRNSNPTPRGGTNRYSAPEVVRGEAVTEAADIYSLGVIGEELLLGQEPSELARLFKRCRTVALGERPTLAELIEHQS